MKRLGQNIKMISIFGRCSACLFFVLCAAVIFLGSLFAWVIFNVIREWRCDLMKSPKKIKTHQTMSCVCYFFWLSSRAWENCSHESSAIRTRNRVKFLWWRKSLLFALTSNKWRNEKEKRHKSYYLKLKKRRTTTIITCRMEWNGKLGLFGRTRSRKFHL